jgi:hypothetical protein
MDDSDDSTQAGAHDRVHDPNTPRERAKQTARNAYREHVLLALGTIGALAWFVALFLKWFGIIAPSYQELALLGAVVSLLLQLDFVPAIFGGLRNRRNR